MTKKWQVALIWLIGIAIVALIVFVGMRNSIERKMISEQVNEAKAEYIDAEEYYNEHGDVKSEIAVPESENLQSEKEAVKGLEDRGFGEYQITTDYSLDGEFLDGQEITGSDDLHPSYQTSYVSSNGELWTIVVMNGTYMANPVSFNVESNLGVQLIFAESETVTCYDSPTNTFYETVLDESELIVKVVDRIDAETLDSLTVEVIKGL